jgi:hypothetical protein
MAPTEKCTRQLPPIRVPESLELALMRLASVNERSLSEYIKLALSHHAFGHASTVAGSEEEGKE